MTTRPEHEGTPTGMTDATDTTYRGLFTSEHGPLAVGILLLEVGAAMTVYILAVVLPRAMEDLDASDAYPVMLSAASIGAFLALAVAQPLRRAWGAGRLLLLGLVLTTLGTLVTASAGQAAGYGGGQAVAAFGSGLLGVLGLGVVIESMPSAYRTRLLALTSAMWVLPGLIGPPLALLAQTGLGWRGALLVPLPVLLGARLLVARAVLTAPSPQRPPHVAARWGMRLLLPLGMAVFVLGSTLHTWWGWPGLALAVVAGLRLLPTGTVRAAPGPPRHLLALFLVAGGYFGARSLTTLNAVRAEGLPVAWATFSLGASAVLWGLTSLVVPRLVGRDHQHGDRVAWLGVGTMAGVLSVWSVAQLIGAVTGPMLLALWCLAGLGMGLAYPVLYVRATHVSSDSGPQGASLDGATLAAAVLLAETLGERTGAALGSGVVDLVLTAGASERIGLHLSTVLFSILLALALVALGKTSKPDAREQ